MYLTRETGLRRFKIFRQTETCLSHRLNDTAAFAMDVKRLERMRMSAI